MSSTHMCFCGETAAYLSPVDPYVTPADVQDETGAFAFACGEHVTDGYQRATPATPNTKGTSMTSNTVSRNASTLTAVGKGERLTAEAVAAVIANAGESFDWTAPQAVANALNAWIVATEGRLPARTVTRTANGHPVKRDGTRAYRVGEVLPDGSRCAKSQQAAQDLTDYGRGYDRVRKAVAAQVRTPSKPAAGIRVIVTDADGATRSLSVEAGSELATAILAALPPVE